MAKYSLSRIRDFLEAYPGREISVGVDVHKRSYHVGVRRTDGACETWVAPARPYDLVAVLLDLGIPIQTVAYEAGPTGFGLCRAVEEAGINCCVVAPSKVLRPVTNGAKTDRLDCLKLADYAAKGMLKPITVPSVREEGERSLIRRRGQIVDTIRRTKQRIKSHLLYFGVEEPSGLGQWARKGVEQLHLVQIEPAAKLALDSLLRELEWQHSELKEVEASLAAIMQTRHEEPMKRLRSVPGVGPIVATTFLLEIFRPERFRCPEEVVSYLGLAPTVRQSGEQSARGRLVPVGQKRLRSLLIEAAWVWQGKVPKVKKRYTDLLSRSGISQKAITAIARRLAILLWHLSLPARHQQTV
jgi:transposase